MEKDGKAIVISLVLGIICVGILGCIIYFKINQKPAKPEENQEVIENTNNETKNETKELEEKDIDKETVNSLYSIIGANPEFRYEDSTTYEDLSENVRDSIVMNALNGECKTESSYEKEYFLAKYKEIFNNSKTADDGLCELENGKYVCTKYCNESGPAVLYEFTKYEKEGNSIIIYETVGHLDYYDDGKIYLRENASDETAIASFDTYEEIANSAVKYKLPTYKHVFNYSDDHYYWASSAIVKTEE